MLEINVTYFEELISLLIFYKFFFLLVTNFLNLFCPTTNSDTPLTFKITATANSKNILGSLNNDNNGIIKLSVKAFHMNSQYELSLKKDRKFLR